MYKNRISEKMITEVAKSFPCIVVYGPRQVGKSTTIDHLFGDRYRKVSLDDLEDRTMAVNNPKGFLEAYGWPLIIDEIQKAPMLLDAIKMNIDEQRLVWMKEDRPRELMYILTGSNRFELQQGISDSLAGRCGIIEMASFSAAEIYDKESALFDPEADVLLKYERKAGHFYRTKKAVYEDIFMGGMPDVRLGVSARDTYFRSYLSTYIEKDVRKLIAADSELLFRNFMELLALRTAQELHYDKIAGSIGIDVRTCKKWISILETSGIIYLLQPYMPNLSNRIIKAPKLYFMDTGLCSYLCKWQDAAMLENCAMSGAFFETYVVSELIKDYYAHNADPRGEIYYYRDIDQKEIDILVVKRGMIYPVEIKKNSLPAKPTKNFRVLEKYKMDIRPGLVVDTCDKIRPINNGAYYCPVSLLW